jgi:hypothetical protein
MSTYTVIGIYDDNGQRFATVVEAESPALAERAAVEDADSDIIIAGVVRDEVEVCG